MKTILVVIRGIHRPIKFNPDLIVNEYLLRHHIMIVCEMSVMLGDLLLIRDGHLIKLTDDNMNMIQDKSMIVLC